MLKQCACKEVIRQILEGNYKARLVKLSELIAWWCTTSEPRKAFKRRLCQVLLSIDLIFVSKMSWLNSIGLFGAFHCWIYLGKGKAKCWYYPQWGLCWNAFNVNLSWIFARPDICLMHQGWCRCKNSKSLICIVLLHFLLVLHVILGLLGSISTSCVICILMLLLLTVLLLPLTVFALFLWTNSFTVIIGETLTIVYIKLMTNIRLPFYIAEFASHRVSLGCCDHWFCPRH